MPSKTRWNIAAAACGVLTFTGYGVARKHHRYVAPSHVPAFEERTVDPILVQAVEGGDVATVARLLDAGASPDTVNRDEEGDGESVLSIAAGDGNLPLVQLLLGRGADINADDFWGGNAVTSAAAGGYCDVVQYLVDRGADVNADDDGATALGYAEHELAETKTDRDRERFRKTVEILKAARAKDNPFALW